MSRTRKWLTKPFSAMKLINFIEMLSKKHLFSRHYIIQQERLETLHQRRQTFHQLSQDNQPVC